jgi:hypothetical protein
MNFANISQFVVGILPYQDYNKTVYCLANAIRENNIKQCVNISGFSASQYFALFVLQASYFVKMCKNNNSGSEH